MSSNTDAVGDAPSGNMAPVDEIRELISTNEGRLGEVYRLTEQGMTPELIASQLNVATVGFVYAYRYQIQAALTGKPTTGTELRRQTVSALNSLLRRARGVLSTAALALLMANKAAVEAAGAELDPTAEAKADNAEKNAAVHTLIDLNRVAGISAFSYGWYLESPVDAERGNTLIKVGLATDVAERIRSYTSGVRTHMPEPLVLMRVIQQTIGTWSKPRRPSTSCSIRPVTPTLDEVVLRNERWARNGFSPTRTSSTVLPRL